MYYISLNSITIDGYYGVDMFKVILPLFSFLLIGVGYFYYANRLPVDLLDRELNCRIFNGDYLQKGRCYRNALYIYLKEPDFRDTALVSFQDLCNEGLYRACYAKDMLKKESSFNFSPFQEHIEVGNSDAIKCIDYSSVVDPFIRDYFCSKSKSYGLFLKDSFLASEIIQNWQPFSDKDYLLHIEHNIVFNDKYNDELYLKNCTNISSDNQKKYCDKFKEVDALRRKINFAAYKSKSLEDVLSLKSSLCTKFPMSCYLILEDLGFLMEVYKLYPDAIKSQMLIDFNLFFEKRLAIWILMKQENNLLTQKTFKDLDLTIKNYFLGNFKEIISHCKLNSTEGCFLGFKNFGEAVENQKILNAFCSGGDAFSCKILKMISFNGVLKIPNEMPIYNLYFYYDDKILKAYLESPLRNLGLLLDRNRIKIISFSIIALFVIQLMILLLFKKTGHVYQFIRQQTLDKIKSRLDK